VSLSDPTYAPLSYQLLYFLSVLSDPFFTCTDRNWARMYQLLGISTEPTIYKSFDRLKMWVWRALLRVSAQQHPQSEHAALDSTFFDRRRASSYFRQRAGRTIQTLKVTTLTDVESLAVLDVHIAARWKHDTKTGPQVVRRNADDLQSVAADNGFQDWHTEYGSPHTTSITSFIIAARQRTQPRKTLSTGQKVTLSGGWPKHRIRQRSARSATPCERWAGIDSSVKSS